jgi:hypothetical protein
MGLKIWSYSCEISYINVNIHAGKGSKFSGRMTPKHYMLESAISGVGSSLGVYLVKFLFLQEMPRPGEGDVAC